MFYHGHLHKLAW